MTVTDHAFQNAATGETTETSAMSGRIRFRYAAGEGAFMVTRVEAELAYTDDRFVGWTIHVPVERAALNDMAPLLQTLGTGDTEVLNLPANEYMEVSMSARPDVLARLSPDLVKLDQLSAMFEAGDGALLDLDNYEQASFRILSVPEEEDVV